MSMGGGGTSCWSQQQWDWMPSIPPRDVWGIVIWHQDRMQRGAMHPADNGVRSLLASGIHHCSANRQGTGKGQVQTGPNMGNMVMVRWAAATVGQDNWTAWTCCHSVVDKGEAMVNAMLCLESVCVMSLKRRHGMWRQRWRQEDIVVVASGNRWLD